MMMNIRENAVLGLLPAKSRDKTLSVSTPETAVPAQPRFPGIVIVIEYNIQPCHHDAL
jgi:hypothetical protein